MARSHLPHIQIDWAAFSRDLREMRVRADVGTRELSRILGLYPSLVSQIERQKPASLKAMLVCCRWMDRNPLSYLMGPQA